MRGTFVRFWSKSILLAGFLCAAGAASADTVAPGQEGELLKFLPPEPGKHICFARVYDADHLARHPKQKVTEIEFRLAYHRFDPDENFPAGQRNYIFEVLAKRRGDDSRATAFGECSPASQSISCSIDCDGGGMVAERVGKNEIRLSFGNYSYLRMSGCGGGEADAADLVPGDDDKEFLLAETSPGECPAYDDW
jgi:hypothetical protein